MTPDQLDHLRDAFKRAMQITDNRGFSYFAGWHGVPFQWCHHHDDLFLPWHRAYLYEFELALQTLVPQATLPWWDWTRSDRIPDAYADPKVGGKDNPLFVREIVVYRSNNPQKAPPRDPGGAVPAVPPLPYKSRWDDAMKKTTFGSFSNAIEKIHDDVHVWVGGIMQDIAWAAYDPLFFAHHAMIDRAWRIWQHKNPGAVPDHSLMDESLQGTTLKVRDVLDVKQLGYDYSGTASHVAGTRP